MSKSKKGLWSKGWKKKTSIVDNKTIHAYSKNLLKSLKVLLRELDKNK